MAGKTKQMGRPTLYTDELALEICSTIAESDRGLDDLCAERDDFPGARTVRTWIVEREDFRQKYACAKDLQADFIAHQTLPLADNCRKGIKRKILPNGDIEDTEGDMVERTRLQIDARKWLAGKLAPKKYGDKIEQTIQNPDGTPLALNIMFVEPSHGED
jgi:hypothetical protein